ncbi:MAG: hypothetical protein Q8R15_01225 [Candidatus Micrarchaeota archaeon]|nr:hypothetical protein [Candidatus Micrarchaeota archaeon]
MLQRPLMKYFQRQQYENVNAILSHVNAISQRLKQREQIETSKKLPRPIILSQLGQAVFRVAPRFRSAGYPSKAITNEVKRRYFPRLTNSNNVGRHVKRLIDMKLLKTPPKKLPRLRAATRGLVENHLHFVEEVLEKGHSYLPEDWKIFLTIREAQKLGRKGLKRGIETHDPKLGFHFGGYLKMRIAAKIEGEIAKRRNAAKNHKPQKKKEERRIAKPQFNLDKLRIKLNRLMKKTNRKHYIGVFALVEQGHTYEQIAEELGVRKQAVHATYKRAAQLANT